LKISKEVRIGVIGLIILFTTLFTFNYLNRSNIFSRNLIIKVKFKELEFLKKGDPVYIKGKEYGKVVAIYKEGDILWTDLDINPMTKMPRNTKAVITELSLMGGRMITLNFTGTCEGDCLKNGDVISGEVMNMKMQVAAAATPILESFGKVADSLMGPNGIDGMIAKAYASAASLAKTTKGLEGKMRGMNKTMPGTIKSFKDLTAGLLKGDVDASEITATREMAMALDSLLDNLSSLTQEDIDGMTELLYILKEQAEAMPETVRKAEKMLVKADDILDSLNLKIASYQEGASGMIPKLLYDGAYKDSLSSSIQNGSEKLRDIREYPERNLSLKKN
jgi:phospholipid/cholesterol/gamma-HCH transport system substrate-binding protein